MHNSDYSFRLDGLAYHVTTFGCQMNKHDSERVCGMLDALGAESVTDALDADIVIYMTCCVREAADVRALGQIASIKNAPSPHERRIVALGGCIGQRDGEKLLDELETIDIVFGTHNLAHLPALIYENLNTEKRIVEVLSESNVFATELPSRREQKWHAWVPITTGCNNFCSYCIVPYVRGREKSRPLEDIVSELSALANEGVVEVTLLGQNVNSYGRDLYGTPQFARVLREAGDTALQRIRFATSHPKDLLPETISAMAEVESVMPQLHLPVQSGSDRILAAMNRRYTSRHYLDLVEQVRDKVGDVALSTDIIVGFPGETEEDFDDTMRLCQEVGYSQAFTFIYSKRAGTPAARMVDDTPREVIQERFDRLVEVVQQSAFDANQVDKGTIQPVLIEGVSKRDSGILIGRSPKNQVVHAPIVNGVLMQSIEGTVQNIRIDTAKTWYLSGTLETH